MEARLTYPDYPGRGTKGLSRSTRASTETSTPEVQSSSSKYVQKFFCFDSGHLTREYSSSWSNGRNLRDPALPVGCQRSIPIEDVLSTFQRPLRGPVRRRSPRFSLLPCSGVTLFLTSSTPLVAADHPVQSCIPAAVTNYTGMVFTDGCPWQVRLGRNASLSSPVNSYERISSLIHS